MSITRHPAIASTGWYSTLRARPANALHQACSDAYGEGEYIGQESFMTASEILSLGITAGAAPGARVLDVCCGSGAPALYLAQETGCRLVGIDLSSKGIRLAHSGARARSLRHTSFLVADPMHLPLTPGFDAALAFDTMLAIQDKPGLLREIGRLLRPGGRLALTLEEGQPLSRNDRRGIPEGENISLVSEADFLTMLQVSGFRVRKMRDRTKEDARIALRLAIVFAYSRDVIMSELGPRLCDQMISTHKKWAELLGTRRVRKLAFIAESARNAPADYADDLCADFADY